MSAVGNGSMERQLQGAGGGYSGYNRGERGDEKQTNKMGSIGIRERNTGSVRQEQEDIGERIGRER